MNTSSSSMEGFILPKEHKTFWVISGSLAHIQKFIYDTPSKEALKNLRGRSFYLSLLTRAVCDYLLHELKLSYDSLLYNSGGTFCIIAPDYSATESDLKGHIKHIKNTVTSLVHDDMVNVCYIQATSDELEENCVEIFKQLFGRKHRAKFIPYGVDADHKLFEVAPRVKSKSYGDIGATLCDVAAIVASREKYENYDVKYIDMSSFGFYYYLCESVDVASGMGDKSYLLLINDVPAPTSGEQRVYREYIAGNGIKANSFEGLFESDSPHHRLAVLRMDVDNLGALLQSAMSRKNALSEYSKLSHSLDTYFKMELNNMWLNSYSESTVIVYAGGDDLFIVGEWVSALRFMQDIHTQFKEFFNGEEMSISGGVVFVPIKYPIIRAAEMSAEEEERAKGFAYNQWQKSAISLFGTPLRWDYEYKWVTKYRNDLLSLIQKELIDKSFINHILRAHDSIEYKSGQITPIRYVWLLAYDLSRMAKRKRRQERNDGERFIERCIADIMSGRTLAGEPIESPYHSLQLIAIAARLVEMDLWNLDSDEKDKRD